MASLVAALGASLRSDGLQPGNRQRSRRSQQPFMCQKILRVIAVVAAVGQGDKVAPISRTWYRKQSLEELAEEVLKFKQQTGNTRYWQLAFLHEKYADMNSSQLKSKRNELRSALKLDGGTSRRLEASSNNLSRRRPEALAAFSAGFTRSALPARSRRRDCTVRWRCSADIDAELWCWFVDRLATNKTRVSTLEIRHAANQYSNAILDAWRHDCDKGLASPDKPPVVPIINNGYVHRWRTRYGVTYRTVNLRYKIPRKTFLSRLQVFWSNCIIIRRLFELMFPGQVLHWVGYDQKPLWFNAISAERTYGIKGQKKVGVAENVSASRARFTAMTSVQDWRTETPPGIGVLFRIGTAACSLDNLRGALQADENTLVQGGGEGFLQTRTGSRVPEVVPQTCI